jgi:SAM-dependent methyltransferase
MTDQPSRAQLASSFGTAAGLYERGRPPYPPEALDWLLPAGARRVLDLGAGTGKLTRQLAARGLDVVAVEPTDGMRAELERVLPGVPALAGSAEQIPLDDGTVDVVLAAQAWHWVDPAQAVPEVARVLAPGGTLGLAWNERDERVDWVAELGRIIGETRGQDEGAGAANTSDHPRVGPPFTPLERHEVFWVHQLSVPELLDMVASRSYIILLPDAERTAVLDRVRQLTQTHPALAGRPDIILPYRTLCWRGRLACRGQLLQPARYE